MTSLFDDLILLGSYILVGMVVIYDVILDILRTQAQGITRSLILELCSNGVVAAI